MESELLKQSVHVGSACCKPSSTGSRTAPKVHAFICAHDGMKQFSHEQISMLAARFRALGEPTRIRIVEVLARGEQPVSRIVSALHADQSNISKHLQVLFHAGLVTRERSASAVIYSLADETLLDLCRSLSGTRPGARRASGPLPAGRAADRTRGR
jgi:DNA-binding transcriptional ArsR family regulator